MHSNHRPPSPESQADLGGIHDDPGAADPVDHRLDLLRRWLAAADRHDVALMRQATRQLRKLGISIVAIEPREERR